MCIFSARKVSGKKEPDSPVCLGQAEEGVERQRARGWGVF